VLLPSLINNKRKGEPDMSQLLADLHFAGHYFMLREYLYCAYNAPGSLTSTISEAGELTIEVTDRTPRWSGKS
jgi:hypothetical protein